MTPKVAVYPGFFDPFTLGHLNIVTRGIQVFDRLIVSIAADSPKKSMFDLGERVELAKTIFAGNPRVEIDTFEGLLVTYLRRRKVGIILRGIRTVSDFEYEYQMALANKTLAADIETFFMMTEGEFSYLSSTVIKEVARLGGDISKMVPAAVVERVRAKYGTQPPG